MLEPWKTLEQTIQYQKKWFSVHTQKVQLPDGRILDPYFVVNVPNWTNIIIATDREELIMVKQYRQATQTFTIEPAGGLIDEGETPLQAAIREMQEETGYTSNQISLLSEVFPNPALQPTKAYFYLAENASPTTSKNFDAFEDIEIVVLPKQDVLSMLQNNQFTNGVQVGAIYKAVLKLGWL